MCSRTCSLVNEKLLSVFDKLKCLMRIQFRFLVLIATVFALGAGGVYAINALHTTKIESIRDMQGANENVDSLISKTLPELVANQIRSGDTICPKLDALTYEGCLLFQGTLGIWQRLGMPEKCPIIIDDDLQKSPRSPNEGMNISPDDALRAPKSACFGYLYAVHVANVTPIIVSTANRVFQMATGHKFIEPGSDALACVIARHGICGNHAAVALALFEKAGLVARPVEFYYRYGGKRHSHIIAEVYIDGDWRPVDITYSAYWPSTQIGQPFRLITTSELLSQKKIKQKPTRNEALFPYGIYSKIAKKDYFNYISSNADVIRGNTGEISLKITKNRGSENFEHLPNFIGDNKSDNQFKGLEFRLFNGSGKYRLTVNVSGSAFSSGDVAFICINQSCEQYSSDKLEYKFEVERPSKLYLKTEMDVAYVVMKSLRWEVVSL